MLMHDIPCAGAFCAILFDNLIRMPVGEDINRLYLAWFSLPVWKVTGNSSGYGAVRLALTTWRLFLSLEFQPWLISRGQADRRAGQRTDRRRVAHTQMQTVLGRINSVWLLRRGFIRTEGQIIFTKSAWLAPVFYWFQLVCLVHWPTNFPFHLLAFFFHCPRWLLMIFDLWHVCFDASKPSVSPVVLSQSKRGKSKVLDVAVSQSNGFYRLNGTFSGCFCFLLLLGMQCCFFKSLFIIRVYVFCDKNGKHFSHYSWTIENEGGNVTSWPQNPDHTQL